MKTKRAASAAASTSDAGSTKPTQQFKPIDGVIRLAGWPDCLADKDVAAAIKGAVYEGYEQKAGARVGVYRV
jgi:hypothetical protein